MRASKVQNSVPFNFKDAAYKLLEACLVPSWSTGDWADAPAQWEPLDIGAIKSVRGTYHPLLDYFGA